MTPVDIGRSVLAESRRSYKYMDLVGQIRSTILECSSTVSSNRICVNWS